MSPYADSADFYVGRGDQAQYIGSRRHGGPPVHLGATCSSVYPFPLTFQSFDVDVPHTEHDYRRTVAHLVDGDGWPWGPDHDPAETPWVYVYDKGSVYVYYRGSLMVTVLCNYRQVQPRGVNGPRAISRNFPNAQGRTV